MRIRIQTVVFSLLLLLLSACSSVAHREQTQRTDDITGPEPAPQAGGFLPTPLRKRVVESALLQLGRPYHFGGSEPGGFDCSGLVQYAYSEAGVVVPRSTREQRGTGKIIRLDDAQPGDLLFYHFGRKKTDLHVGLYLGDGKMIHAPSSGRQVSIVRVDEPQWVKRYIDAIRILP